MLDSLASADALPTLRLAHHVMVELTRPNSKVSAQDIFAKATEAEVKLRKLIEQAEAA